MAHSPELYNKVCHKADLYLTGHTHGGQIRIPRIGAVFTHCKAPRRVCSGHWSEGNMQGYTSNGVGVSGVPVRFNCPGEIVILTLRCGPQKDMGRKGDGKQETGSREQRSKDRYHECAVRSTQCAVLSAQYSVRRLEHTAITSHSLYVFTQSNP
jgi:hypothetical protein